MVFFGIVLVALVFLYVRWRVAYGYPPEDVPTVLCYHKLSTRFRLEGTWVTPRRFADQMERLLDRGYRFIGEDEFYGILSRRSAERSDTPARSKDILLTFDDGYEGIYEVFLEHLAPRRLPALVFVITDYAGRRNTWDLSLGRPAVRHLTWGQIGEMIDAGAAIGVHGATHADLTRVSPPAVEREVAGARRTVFERTGKMPRSFSYPFGRYNDEVRTACEKAGYDGAFSLYPRHGNGSIDRFALRRNGVYVIDTNLTLRWKIERTPFFWFEETKCRTINSVATLTPMLKRASPGPDT
jgi:peptidoglycan/xylan/chitin deacetylase (PgdA/CDA1 family)